jgi:hypothetical protein
VPDGGPLFLVNTHKVTSEMDAMAHETNYVSRGFEGLIVRISSAKYQWNDRSYDLLKIKNFMDREFAIVDAKPRLYFPPGGGGPITILDKFVCRVPGTDSTFETVPTGSYERREEMWRNRDTLIGEQAVVRFFEYSIDGKPQGNPVTVAIRLPEDTPSTQEQEGWD